MGGEDAGRVPIYLVAARNHVDAMEWLFKHGANSNRAHFDKNPLHSAARAENTEACAALIAGGAKVAGNALAIAGTGATEATTPCQPSASSNFSKR